MSSREKEVIKVEVPRELAEEFRRYVAEKYGLRRGSLSRAIIELIEKELAYERKESGDVVSILGLGLESDYAWRGEDLIEALRKRYDVSSRRKRDS